MEATESTKKRDEIQRQIEAAENLRNWPGRYFPAIQKARAALVAWRTRYPAEAAEDDARALDQRAERLRDQADGCLGQDGLTARRERLLRESAACDWDAVALTWPALPDGSNPVAALAQGTAAALRGRA